LSGSPLVFGQIRGTVQESDGSPSYDAKVEIKNTGVSTRTDENGSFELPTAKAGDILVISDPLGEEVREVKASNDLTFKFTRSEKELEGVTLIGTIKLAPPSQRIGAVSTINSEALENSVNASINSALATTPGITFGQAGGMPGAGSNVIVRGINSLSGSSNPLYVIDGVPMGRGSDNSQILTFYTSFDPMSLIDPNSIESITVLKDAASTSLYGAQGANGVILITTKKGKYNQKTKFTFNAEYGYQTVGFDKFHWMSSSRYMDWGALTYAGYDYQHGVADAYEHLSDYRQEFIDDIGWDGETNTNWAKAARRNTATLAQYSFNAMGGSDNTSFTIGGSYYQNKPLIQNSSFDRIGFNTSVNHKASEKVLISFTGNVNHLKTSAYDDQGSYSNPWGASWEMLPIYSVKNPDGSYNQDLGGMSGFNTVELLQSNFMKADITSFFGSIGLDYKFAKNFKFNTLFAPKYDMMSEKTWWNQLTGTGANICPPDVDPDSPDAVFGLIQEADTRIFEYSWTNFVNYSNKFNGKHDLSVDVGMEYQEHNYRSTYAGGIGFPLYAPVELRYAVYPSGVDSWKEKWTQISYIARGAYTYANRYSVTAQVREDGNSVFGADNKWGTFWNVGGLWTISNEDFLKGNSVLSSLKIRANYGTIGNATNATWNNTAKALPLYTGLAYTSNPGLYVSSAGNPDLKWETAKELDLGLDFGLFDDKIRGTFDYYNRKTDDLITNVAIPPTDGTGYVSSYLANIGSIRNRGVELTLNFAPVKNQDIVWDMTLAGSYNRSKILKLQSGLGVDGITGNAFGKALKVGQQIGEYYLYGYAGVDRATGAALFYTDRTKTATTTNLSEAQRYFQGSTNTPNYTASFSNSISYKGFSLSFTFAGEFDFKVFDTYQSYWMSDGQYAGSMNQESSLLNSWTPDNPNAKNPIQVIGNGSNSNYTYSTRFLHRGDNIRLKEAKLSYTLGKNILGEDSPIDGVTVYVKGTNLFLWAFDKGLKWDPDTYYTYPGQVNYPAFYGAGMYGFTSPIMRVYSFGINLNF